RKLSNRCTCPAILLNTTRHKGRETQNIISDGKVQQGVGAIIHCAASKHKRVITSTAGEGVITSTAGEGVITNTAGEGVIQRRTNNCAVAGNAATCSREVRCSQRSCQAGDLDQKVNTIGITSRGVLVNEKILLTFV